MTKSKHTEPPATTTRPAIVWFIAGLAMIVIGGFLPEAKLGSSGGFWNNVVFSVGGFMFLGGAYWIIKNARAKKRESQQGLCKGNLSGLLTCCDPEVCPRQR
jgi:predicted phage tail protein